MRQQNSDADRKRLLAKAAWVVLAGLFAKILHYENQYYPLWMPLTLCCGLWLGGLAATGKILSGGYIAVLVYGALVGTSLAKYEVLEIPLTGSDFLSVTGAELLEMAKAYPQFAALLALFPILAVSIELFSRRAPFRLGYPQRILALLLGGLSLLIISLGVLDFQQERYVSAGQNRSHSVLRMAWSLYQDPRLISNLPPQPHPPLIGCPKNPPNIFAILEESTFRPLDLEKNPVNGRFYEGNVFSGPLRVHTVSGNTILTDFAFHVGLPHTAFIGDNTNPRLRLERRIHHALPKTLKKCGYITSVIYPVPKDFRNGERWFADIGVDHLIASEEEGISNLERWSMPDEKIFEKSLEHLRSLPAGPPKFVYLLTIAQHGPHDPDDPRADFFKRLAKSAEAELHLRQRLSADAKKRGRDWLLAWFGDHRPAMVDADGEDRFITWGAINRLPITADRPPLPPGRTPVDIAFFSRLLLKEAGVSVQALENYQDAMLEQCPSDYMSCPSPLHNAYQREFIDIGGYTSRPQRNYKPDHP